MSSSNDSDSAKEYPEADWAHWNLEFAAKAWEVAALSLGYEPSGVLTYVSSDEETDEILSDTFNRPHFRARFPENFRSRLAAIGEAIYLEQLPSQERQTKAEEQPRSIVAFADFAAFALSMGWEIPPQLAARASQVVALAAKIPADKEAPGKSVRSGAAKKAYTLRNIIRCLKKIREYQESHGGADITYLFDNNIDDLGTSDLIFIISEIVQGIRGIDWTDSRSVQSYISSNWRKIAPRNPNELPESRTPAKHLQSAIAVGRERGRNRRQL